MEQKFKSLFHHFSSEGEKHFHGTGYTPHLNFSAVSSHRSETNFKLFLLCENLTSNHPQSCSVPEFYKNLILSNVFVIYLNDSHKALVVKPDQDRSIVFTNQSFDVMCCDTPCTFAVIITDVNWINLLNIISERSFSFWFVCLLACSFVRNVTLS